MQQSHRFNPRNRRSVLPVWAVYAKTNFSFSSTQPMIVWASTDNQELTKSWVLFGHHQSRAGQKKWIRFTSETNNSSCSRLNFTSHHFLMVTEHLCVLVHWLDAGLSSGKLTTCFLMSTFPFLLFPSRPDTSSSWSQSSGLKHLSLPSVSSRSFVLMSAECYQQLQQRGHWEDFRGKIRAD